MDHKWLFDYTKNIYKSRNILIEILQNRNYNVDDYNEFSINEINIMVSNNQLDLFLENKNNTKIFVKYYLGKSLRPNNIQEIVEDSWKFYTKLCRG